MVTDFFGSLLQEIGRSFNVTLQPDKNNSCLFLLPNKVSIQMELDKKNEYFIIGADLGPVPFGRYRENLFRQALRANGFPTPRNGTFAYSKQQDHLLLVEMLHLKNISGDKIVTILKPMIEKAFTWKSAINNGEVPQISEQEGKSSGGLFGLKR